MGHLAADSGLGAVVNSLREGLLTVGFGMRPMDEQILLVDDESNRCRLLQRKLERYGLAVRSVGSIDEAMAGENLPPRVMVVDLGLLCGPERASLSELVDRLLSGRIYRCNHCGRCLREMEPGKAAATAPQCCGETMELTETSLPDVGKEATTC